MNSSKASAPTSPVEKKSCINQKDVLDFNIYQPPLDLQNEFANFVQQIAKSKVATQKALDETQLLFDSLMQEYFG